MTSDPLYSMLNQKEQLKLWLFARTALYNSHRFADLYNAYYALGVIRIELPRIRYSAANTYPPLKERLKLSPAEQQALYDLLLPVFIPAYMEELHSDIIPEGFVFSPGKRIGIIIEHAAQYLTPIAQHLLVPTLKEILCAQSSAPSGALPTVP